jgi:vacuolar protein sorting-associated protein 35
VAEEDSNWDKKVQKIYQFVHQSISALVKAECVELALRLFLQAALTADKTPFDKAESIAYEFMGQAFQLYEEDISDSKAQIAAVRLIVAALESTSCFTDESFTPLSTKCALVCSKLVSKPDQCRGVAACAHLFWSGKTAPEQTPKRDAKQVVQCLQRGLKVTSSLMEAAAQAQLYAEMLDKYCYFYEQGVDTITVAHLNKICALVHESIAKLETGEEADITRKYFQQILGHISYVKGA